MAGSGLRGLFGSSRGPPRFSSPGKRLPSGRGADRPAPPRGAEPRPADEPRAPESRTPESRAPLARPVPPRAGSLRAEASRKPELDALLDPPADRRGPLDRPLLRGPPSLIVVHSLRHGHDYREQNARKPRGIHGAFSTKYVRLRPTLPHRHQCSTIGAEGLSFRVRNGAGRFPFAMTAETLWRFQSFPTVPREPHSGRVASLCQVIGLLVPVSSVRYRTSTSGLSTQ